MTVKRRLQVVVLETTGGITERLTFACGCITARFVAAGVPIWIHIERCDRHPEPPARITLAKEPPMPEWLGWGP